MSTDQFLKDKVALVTGSARGIGKSIAEDLAAVGADCVILDIKKELCEETAKEIGDKYGVKTLAIECNVTDKKDVEDAADEIKAKFKTLNFLVNNAGITRDDLLIRMKEADWDLVMDVNLKGPFLMTQACLRMMMRAEPARIINVSSISGIVGAAGQANYSSSKAGLIGFTKVTAKEYASKGILCNAICPGFISTDMTDEMPEAAREALKESVPLGRPGEVKDISRVVRFLCSEDSGYITGNVIRIDGGMATGF